MPRDAGHGRGDDDRHGGTNETTRRIWTLLKDGLLPFVCHFVALSRHITAVLHHGETLLGRLDELEAYYSVPPRCYPRADRSNLL